ncbi:hypothetical protein XPA_009794 [Xanthoria parietina]
MPIERASSSAPRGDRPRRLSYRHIRASEGLYRSKNAVQRIKLVTHGICCFASTTIGDPATSTASTHILCGSTIRVSNLETLPANFQEQKDRSKSVCNSSVLDMMTATRLR